MSGQPTLTERLRALAPSLLFYSYALFVALQFAVSAQAATTLAFYAAMLPATFLYIYYHPDSLKMLLRDPIIQALGVLFAYIILHALLLTADHSCLDKTLLNTVMTALFILCSAEFFSQADPRKLHMAFRAMVLLAAACAVISLLLFAVAAPPDQGLVPLGRAHHEILGSLSYGIAGLTALYLAKLAPTTRQKYGYFLIIGVIALMIVLTRARTAIAVHLLCLAAGYLFYFKTSRRLIVAVMALAALVALLFCLIPSFQAAMHGYADALLLKKDGMRRELWQLTWQRITEHPWIGNGMRATIPGGVAYSPHNLYLATAFYIGIPGLLLFLYPLALCVIRAIRLLRSHKPLSILLALILFEGLISALTEHGQLVKAPGPVWFIFWMPVAFVIARTPVDSFAKAGYRAATV